ncbi:hypothetical protein MC885_013343 [Smutsia gigantea]|nr:hypothetical protein MC885_013343 [Smutsia gigantea]
MLRLCPAVSFALVAWKGLGASQGGNLEVVTGSLNPSGQQAGGYEEGPGAKGQELAMGVKDTGKAQIQAVPASTPMGTDDRKVCIWAHPGLRAHSYKPVVPPGLSVLQKQQLRPLKDWRAGLRSLKRSFEVEEVETPNSTPPRRVQTPLLRATVASSTQKFQDLGVKNSEPAARHVDSLSQRSPKAALRRVELSGPKAEPVSRRTEISIDISSKQVENAGATGPSRFGLKRAEVLGHKTPEPTPRRTEITIVKPQESAHRRMENPTSKIPEGPAAPTTDPASRRVEIQVPRPAEVPASPNPPQTLENSEPSPMSPLQSRLEPKPQAPVAEAPPKSQEGE